MNADVSGLAGLPSVMAEDVAGLARKGSRRHHRSGSTNVCLITLNNVLNDANVLSGVLSLFGGGLGL
ncbi:MAG: hypothetical protein ACRDZ3_16900 [Acidimicrobiia bacterium]